MQLLSVRRSLVDVLTAGRLRLVPTRCTQEYCRMQRAWKRIVSETTICPTQRDLNNICDRAWCERRRVITRDRLAGEATASRINTMVRARVLRRKQNGQHIDIKSSLAWHILASDFGVTGRLFSARHTGPPCASGRGNRASSSCPSQRTQCADFLCLSAAANSPQPA